MAKQKRSIHMSESEDKETCPCGLSTCTESWEEGCGLGGEDEFARIVTDEDTNYLRSYVSDALGEFNRERFSDY
jgi:hypothetical protein